MARVVATNISSNSSTFYIENAEFGNGYIADWYVMKTDAGGSDIVVYEDGIYIDSNGKSDEITIEGLDANTEYVCLCYIYQWRLGTKEFLYDLPLQCYFKTDNTIWSVIDKGSITINANKIYYIEGENGDYITLPSGCIFRYKLNFESSGTARFIDLGDYTTYGYITTSQECNTEEGVPYDIVASHTPEKWAFEISNVEVLKNTTYYLWVRPETYVETVYFSVSISHTASQTEPDTPDISLWNWQSSNGGADSNTTYTAYLALINKDFTTNFSHLVWNDLVEKVREAYICRDGSVSDETLISWLNNAKMTNFESGHVLTALRFNNLRQSIGGLKGFSDTNTSIKEHYENTGQWDMAQGEDVRGEYIEDLAKQLNLFIEEIM